MTKPSVIAFDADDTLWVNEPIFNEVEDKFAKLLLHYTSEETLKKKLFDTEIKNLHIFGYGVKGFMLSMIETAIELTNGQITGDEIHKIISWGKDMLQHPVHLLDGIEETLKELHGDYKLMIITKGDLFDQESKIARSGLADYFDHIEIVSEKDEKTYQQILDKYNIAKEEFLMIGNSAKSDVLPLINIGSQAIHIPYHTTWEHEKVDEAQKAKLPYIEISEIKQIFNYLNK
ncbi:HAD family hydrolase [Sediminitomix flava]|uniref:Putative hydrolase of the HAD superfamily n=1 Tax=Sediminitomix flava TaxID=379075 RepID=A0A315Z6W1_SEDFL|nr:HAD family hydrolase [Sediminitomix flava]PWJ39962.1 putative hydrolase of the HAD superfamily [Sediminitomix flava]